MATNVIQFKSRRRSGINLSDAMCAALNALGGQASPMDTAQWIREFITYRKWSYATIRSYFYAMSKPQRFRHISRGSYGTTRQYAKIKAG